jgi:hypothetical protein
MNELKFIKCNEVFKVDESGFSEMDIIFDFSHDISNLSIIIKL